MQRNRIAKWMGFAIFFLSFMVDCAGEYRGVR